MSKRQMRKFEQRQFRAFSPDFGNYKIILKNRQFLSFHSVRNDKDLQ